MKKKIKDAIKWFDMRKFVKFGCIGVLNTVIDIGSFFVLNKILLLGSYTSQTMAVLLAATNSFLWNKYWTFEKKSPATKKEIGHFIVVQTSYLICSLIAMSVMIDQLGMDPFIAKFPTAVVMVLYNYIMSKVWIFVD